MNYKYSGDYQSWHMTDNKKPESGGARHNIMLFIDICVCCAVFIVSLLLLFNDSVRIEDYALAGVAGCALVAVVYFFFIISRTAARVKRAVELCVFSLTGAAAMYLFPVFFDIGFALVCGLLGLTLGLLELLNVFRRKHDGTPCGWTLAMSLIYIGLSLGLIFSPERTRLAAALTGVYLLFFSLDMLFDCLLSLFRLHPRLKRRFTFSLPTIIAAFLPIGFFREVNMLVREDPAELRMMEQPDPGTPPDLIVYIHTRAGIQQGFGHCDLCFDGKVYSFGNYDESSWRLGGFFADGVLALIPPQKHIDFAIKYNKKILAAYGLHLTDKHKEEVAQRLREIEAMTYPWESCAQRAEEGKLPGSPDSYNDVGSQMYRLENAVMYKFRHGCDYETYNGIGMNCVELVNDVVGKSGIDLIKFNGIVTPGTYLEYLDSLYRIGDTIVTDRRLYRTQNGTVREVPLAGDQAVVPADYA